MAHLNTNANEHATDAMNVFVESKIQQREATR